MPSFQLINKKIKPCIIHYFCNCSSFIFISGITVALHLMTVICILVLAFFILLIYLLKMRFCMNRNKKTPI